MIAKGKRISDMNPIIQVIEGKLEGHIIVGDALAAETWADIPDGSVHTCVTSPPYWGLRDYGTATWEGGDAECDHIERTAVDCAKTSTLGSNRDGLGEMNAAHQGKVTQYKDICPKCGARRIDAQLGLEKTPEEYVEHMVAVFRHVWRVLRDDGTLWLNLGDSYTSGGRDSFGPATNRGKGEEGHNAIKKTPRAPQPSNLKPKDLCGIPWRVAFALQADGWYLRSDIIWSKPNPIPESVTDRPTKAHEYLFLLTKKPRYFYDAEAIREEAKPWNKGMMRAPKCGPGRPKYDTLANDSGNVSVKQYDEIKGANRRTVWTVPTQPYPEAHFATFPPKLVEPCILAGTSEKGCCPACGSPWTRITKKKQLKRPRPNDRTARHEAGDGINSCGNTVAGVECTTIGWRAGCRCGDALDPIPCIVLDPFIGSGTTASIATKLGRNYIGIDLSSDYIKLAEKRVRRTPSPMKGERKRATGGRQTFF